MHRVHPPTRCQAGTRLLHTGFLPDWLDHHQFPKRAQKGKKSFAASPPRCMPAPRPPPCDRTPPGVLRVVRGALHPPSNIENDANQLISKNSKISNCFSNVINTLDCDSQIQRCLWTWRTICCTQDGGCASADAQSHSGRTALQTLRLSSRSRVGPVHARRRAE